MYWFNIIPVKIPGVFFLEVGKVILRLIWKNKQIDSHEKSEVT